MRREDAVMIDNVEAQNLNTIDEAINYLMRCYRQGLNVYLYHNDVILYSCDGYTYDEYYIQAMGLSSTDQKSLDNLIYGEGRTAEDRQKIFKLILPVYTYIKGMNEPLCQELRNGKNQKKIS